MTASSKGGRATDSITDLAARFDLSAEQAGQLEDMGRLLAEDPLAPTTIRDPAQVIRDHLADSLVALELSEVTQARAVADLGAGAGLPGLCLAIARPSATIRLVEANARKCRFLSQASDALGLANVEIVNRRVEEWSEGAEACDLVTARALAAPEVVLEYAAPLLVLAGHLVAWRGQDGAQITSRSERAAAQLGLVVERSIRVHPYSGSEHRHLLLAAKRAPTPSSFPRRPGMAVKRPLGDA